MTEERNDQWKEIEEEKVVEFENISEKRRIKVELGKEMEVETEAEKEFNNHIVGYTYKTEVETDQHKCVRD